jgi:hypothetical protein
MSNKGIGSLLESLDKVLGKKREANKTDWKELAELKKKSFTKLKPGKNNIAIVPLDTKDPFVIWGYHNSLQETSFWSVPCDAYNKDKDCIVCNVIEELKKEDEQGNKHLWYPIRQQFEFYAPVVNLESEETIKEGIKWLRFGKLIMSQFKEWLSNTDEDEEPFYSDDEPQKIIIAYDKSAAPGDMYKLDKKRFKPFGEQQLADWRGSLKPVQDFVYSKSQDEMKKIVDKYFERIAGEVATPDEPVVEDEEDDDDATTEVVDKIPSKLDRLKKK